MAGHARDRVEVAVVVEKDRAVHLGDRRSGVSFLDGFERTARLRLEFVSRDLEEEALRWLRGRDDCEYSFVDATSFAVMRSLRIREALAFDGDFAAAGFMELRL